MWLFNSAASVGGLHEIELLLDERSIFRGEIAAGSCESLLFTRDQSLIGRILRTMHAHKDEVAERQQRRQQQQRRRSDEMSEGDKRVVRLWRDGVEVMYRPSNVR